MHNFKRHSYKNEAFKWKYMDDRQNVVEPSRWFYTKYKNKYTIDPRIYFLMKANE